MDLTIIIPARKESSRLSKKVLLPLGNFKSLIELKIYQCINTGIKKKNIILNSEDDEILNIGEQLSISTKKREMKYSVGHEIPFTKIIIELIKEVKTKHIAWVTPVVPYMDENLLKSSFNKYFKKNRAYDSLTAVTELKEYFWFKNKPLNYNATEKHIISQSLEPLYKITNGLYMAEKRTMLENKYFLGKKPLLYTVPYIAGIDIDTKEDYELVQMFWKKYKEI